MAAVANIIFNATTAGFDRGRMAVEKGLESVGRKASGARQQIEQMGTGFVKSVIGVTAIVAALKQAVQAIEEVKRAQEGIGAEVGGRRLEAATALAAAGITGDAQQPILSAIEASTDPARALAAVRGAGRAVQSDPQRLAALASAAGTGLFTEAEIQRAGQTGAALDVSARRGALAPSAQAELGVRETLARERMIAEMNAGSQAEGRITTARLSRQEQESALLNVALTLFGPVGGKLYARNFVDGEPIPVTMPRRPSVNGQD